MIVIPRGLARSFRTVARSCVAGRPRGPAPPVVVRVHAGRLSLATTFADVFVIVTVPAPPDAVVEAVLVPADAFARADTAGEVQITSTADQVGRLRWTNRSGPGEVAFDVPVGKAATLTPEILGEMTPVSSALLTALHECGRTTADESTRFALTRVQVRGQHGQVIGTDGAVALVRCGFKLPFTEDLLVPAVRAFGRKELAARADIRVGRTETHLVVAAGPWAVGLRVDRGGRYPDVAGVIPRRLPTTVEVDDTDASNLMEFLSKHSGRNGDSTVTLVVNGGVSVRRGDNAVRLRRSTFTGIPAAIVIDAAALHRLLDLGCRTIRFGEPDNPLVADGPDTTFVAVTRGPATAPPPTPRTTMPPREPPGRSRPGNDEPTRSDADDPLVLAEAVHAALADAGQHAARLVRALRSHRRERKALRSAFTSLKALGLEGGRP